MFPPGRRHLLTVLAFNCSATASATPCGEADVAAVLEVSGLTVDAVDRRGATQTLVEDVGFRVAPG